MIRELGRWQELPPELSIDNLLPEDKTCLRAAGERGYNISERVAARHDGLSHLPKNAVRLRLYTRGGGQPEKLEIWPSMYVGHMALPIKNSTFVLHVHPKLREDLEEPIYGIVTLNELHALLIRFCAERRRKLRITDQRAFDSSQSPFMLEALARVLCDSVRQLAAVGVEEHTKRQRLVGPSVRGAFDLRAQLNRRPHTVAQRFYAPVHSQRLESTKDLEPNRRIRAALRKVEQQSALSSEVRQAAAALLDYEFDGVSDSTYGIDILKLPERETPEHYGEALDLAELLLCQWSQGGPGSEMRGIELLQPGWVMWEEGVRAALDMLLFESRMRGDRSLCLTAKGSLVFGDRSAGDDGTKLLHNPRRTNGRRGRIFPDMLLKLPTIDGDGIICGVPPGVLPGVLCGDCKYFAACAPMVPRCTFVFC